MCPVYTRPVLNDDLLRSLSASRKMAEALRPQLAAFDKLGKLAKPSRQMTELVRRNEEAMRPLRQAAAVRLSPLDAELAAQWRIRRDTATLRTQEAAEAMLAEMQAGAERERAGAERQRRMFWLAVISVGVAAVSTATNVLPALLG